MTVEEKQAFLARVEKMTLDEVRRIPKSAYRTPWGTTDWNLMGEAVEIEAMKERDRQSSGLPPAGRLVALPGSTPAGSGDGSATRR